MSSRRPDGFFPRRGRSGRGFFPRRGNFIPRARKSFHSDLRQANRNYKSKFNEDDYKHHSRSQLRHSRSRSRSPSYHRYRRSRSRSRSYSRSPSSRSRSRTPKRYRRSPSPRRYNRSYSRTPPRKYKCRSPSPRTYERAKQPATIGSKGERPNATLGSPKSEINVSLYDADVPIKPEGFKDKFMPITETTKNLGKLLKKEEAVIKSKDLPIYSDDDSNNENSNDAKDKTSKPFLRTLDENKDIRTILLERALLEKKKLGLVNPGTSEKSSALEALRCYSPEACSPIHEKSIAKKSILKNRCLPETSVEKKSAVKALTTMEDSWSLRGLEKMSATRVTGSGEDWAGILGLEKKEEDINWRSNTEEKKPSAIDSSSDWNLRLLSEKTLLDDRKLKRVEKKSLAESWNFKAFERNPEILKEKSPTLPTIPGLGFSSVDDEDAFLYGEEVTEEKKQVESKNKFDKSQRPVDDQLKTIRENQSKSQPIKERSNWSDDDDGTILCRSRNSRTPSPLVVGDQKLSKRHFSHSWNRNEEETIDLQLSIGKNKRFSDDLLRVKKSSLSLPHKPSPITYVAKPNNDWESDSPPSEKCMSRKRSPDLTDDLMVVSSRDRAVFGESKRQSVTPQRHSYQNISSSLEAREHYQERDLWLESPPRKPLDSPARRSLTPKRESIYREKSPFFASDNLYSTERKHYRSQSPYEDSYHSKRDWSPYSNSPYRSPPLESMDKSHFDGRNARYSPSPPPRSRYKSPTRGRSQFYDSPIPLRKRRSLSPVESPPSSPRRRQRRERYRSPPRSGRHRQYSSSPSPVRNEPHSYQENRLGVQQIPDQMHGPPHISQPVPIQSQPPPQMQPFFNTNPAVVYQDPNFVQQFQPPPLSQQTSFFPSQFPVPAFPPPTSINFSIPPPNFQQQQQPPPAPQMPLGAFLQPSRTNLKVIPIQSEPLIQEDSPVKEPIPTPSPVRHHFVPLTPVAEAPKLSEGQRRHLICLCEEKKSRLSSLKRDQEQLQKVQGEMMRKKQRQKDGHKDPLLLENAKQQEEISRQINEINSTVSEAERRLGFIVNPRVEPSPPKGPTSKLDKKAKKEKLKEEAEQESSSKFEYFDPGSHWCELCNEVCPNIHAILEHVHDAMHKEKIAPFERPWKDLDPKKDYIARAGIQPILAPIKGVQFLIPVAGYYCKVCNGFMGDIVAAEAHLKNNEHNKNYTKFTLSNPHYEKKWSNCRTHALNKLQKESRKKQKEMDEKKAAKNRKQAEVARRKNKELIKAERQLQQDTQELEESSQQRSPSDATAKAIKLTLLGKQKKTVPVVYIGRAPNYRPKEEPSKATFGKFNWSSKSKAENPQPKVASSPPSHQFPLRKSKNESLYQRPIGPEPPPNFAPQSDVLQQPSEGDIAMAFSGNASVGHSRDTFETIPMDLDEPPEYDPPIMTAHKISREEEKDLALLGIDKEDFALLAKPRVPSRTIKGDSISTFYHNATAEVLPKSTEVNPQDSQMNYVCASSSRGDNSKNEFSVGEVEEVIGNKSVINVDKKSRILTKKKKETGVNSADSGNAVEEMEKGTDVGEMEVGEKTEADKQELVERGGHRKAAEEVDLETDRDAHSHEEPRHDKKNKEKDDWKSIDGAEGQCEKNENDQGDFYDEISKKGNKEAEDDEAKNLNAKREEEEEAEDKEEKVKNTILDEQEKDESAQDEPKQELLHRAAEQGETSEMKEVDAREEVDKDEEEEEDVGGHEILDECGADVEAEEEGDSRIVENVSASISVRPEMHEEAGHEEGDSLPLDFVVLDEISHREDLECVNPCKDDGSHESDGEGSGSEGTIIMGDVELLDEAKCSGEDDESNDEG